MVKKMSGNKDLVIGLIGPSPLRGEGAAPVGRRRSTLWEAYP